ncbi:hypothetical protein C9374_002009 [Naegleria lovaniensis]|uniref:Transmembrane protein n=1 Tax=Naegleria lovaniensis TaxID=51637 RepID=A0AA88GWE1_NAELO|nr:uncharacterized protein C9374_002009 [Naegleria lovaniensis]KAG2386974.1 hypothetical protein C9374_002009 [Naegleria lovaniensis]
MLKSQNPINSSALNTLPQTQQPSNEQQDKEPRIFILFNMLKLEKPIHPLLCLLIHVYMIIQTFSLGISIDYHWGSYGRIVQHVLISFSSFGVQFLEYYEGFIAILAVAIVLQLAVMILLVATFRATIHGKYLKELRKISRLAFATMFFLSCPLTYGMALGFWDCNYFSSSFTNQTEMVALRKFPSIPCWNSTNSVLAVLSLMLIVIQMVTSFMTTTVFCDTFLTSKSLFVLETPFIMSYVMTSNQLYIILSIVTPHHVMYLRPIYYILISTFFCVLLLRNLPFLRRRANTFYGGIGLARVGIGIASLVSSILNPYDEWQFGLGLSFSPLVAGLLGFTLGCLITELYTLYLFKKGKNAIAECIEQQTTMSEDHECPMSHYFNRYTKHVNCFIRSSLKTTHQSNVQLIEDVLKVLQKQQKHHSMDALKDLPCSSLMLLSLFLSSFKKKHSMKFKFSECLLSIANQKCPSYDYFTRYTISFRFRELQYDGKASLASTEFVLSRVKSNIPKLRKQTYLFWKHIHLGLDVHQILQNMYKLSQECELSLYNMIREREDEDLIKLYASFMEEFKFEKVTEDEFSQIENELLFGNDQTQDQTSSLESSQEEDFVCNQKEAFSSAIRKQVGNDKTLIGLLTSVCFIAFLFIMGLVTCNLASTEKHDFNSIMLKSSHVSALPYLTVSEIDVLWNTSLGNITRTENILSRGVGWIDSFVNSYETDVPFTMKQNVNNFSEYFVFKTSTPPVVKKTSVMWFVQKLKTRIDDFVSHYSSQNMNTTIENYQILSINLDTSTRAISHFISSLRQYQSESIEKSTIEFISSFSSVSVLFILYVICNFGVCYMFIRKRSAILNLFKMIPKKEIEKVLEKLSQKMEFKNISEASDRKKNSFPKHVIVITCLILVLLLLLPV